MRRCEHDVYKPDWIADSEPNPYCSGCCHTDYKMLPPTEATPEHYYKECPECGSDDFRGDDWNGYCPKCEYSY